MKIFPLLTLATAPQPSSQKTFYKADRAQIKWNALGTACLVLTQTDVDNSNKSYYGETSLYLLHNGYGPRGDNGGSGERVTLDKEGPIHDFSWSGSSKEFGVVYGCESLLRALSCHTCVLTLVAVSYACKDSSIRSPTPSLARFRPWACELPLFQPFLPPPPPRRLRKLSRPSVHL